MSNEPEARIQESRSVSPWLSLNYDSYSIQYREKADNPGRDEQYIGGVVRAQRRYRLLRYHDRWAFVSALFGYPVVRTDYSTGTKFLSRVLPYTCGDVLRQSNNTPYLVPRSVDRMQGVGPRGYAKDDGTNFFRDPTSTPTFARADIYVTFESVPYSILPDSMVTDQNLVYPYPDESWLFRYVSRMSVQTSEWVTLPRGAYYWVDTPKVQVDGTNNRLQSYEEITLTWHEVPGLPVNRARLVGCVNSSTFDGKPAETMQLVSINYAPHRIPYGIRCYNIEYKFRYFNPSSGVGHNHFLRMPGNSGDPVWQRISSDGTAGGKPVFPLVDFAPLFRPPFDNVESEALPFDFADRDL